MPGQDRRSARAAACAPTAGTPRRPRRGETRVRRGRSRRPAMNSGIRVQGAAFRPSPMESPPAAQEERDRDGRGRDQRERVDDQAVQGRRERSRALPGFTVGAAKSRCLAAGHPAAGGVRLRSDTCSPTLDVQRALEGRLAQGRSRSPPMWSSGTGPSASMNVTPSARRWWLDAAVDDADVARAHLPRLVADRHRDRAVEDQHHLLRVLVRVPCDGCPRHVRDLASRKTWSPAIARSPTPSVEDGEGSP